MTDDWQDRAACREPGRNPEDWFPDKSDPAAAAIRICELCPARLDCLRFAINNHIGYGIFGGLTHLERRKLTRKTTSVHHTPETADYATYNQHLRAKEEPCEACRAFQRLRQRANRETTA